MKMNIASKQIQHTKGKVDNFDSPPPKKCRSFFSGSYSGILHFPQEIILEANVAFFSMKQGGLYSIRNQIACFYSTSSST